MSVKSLRDVALSNNILSLRRSINSSLPSSCSPLRPISMASMRWGVAVLMASK